jgi:hypothetical protein
MAGRPGVLRGTGPVDTGTAPVVVSDHRTITGSVSGQERIHRHYDGSDAGRGHGNGNRRGRGRGNGHGEGNDNGHGNGRGQGNGNGNGDRNGNGHGNGNAQVLSISSQPPR